eukprot:TRINITY_DN8604_c0_g1_i1.p1 TRINITY_DN8604_c0_g1~~TRINITY_DN8604_c0_g1_i1.p1  ORF type:complete len:518 (+),score=202.04 TRINITY_DN8604_c0_g1_i1:32-1585(+)
MSNTIGYEESFIQFEEKLDKKIEEEKKIKNTKRKESLPENVEKKSDEKSAPTRKYTKEERREFAKKSQEKNQNNNSQGGNKGNNPKGTTEKTTSEKPPTQQNNKQNQQNISNNNNKQQQNIKIIQQNTKQNPGVNKQQQKQQPQGKKEEKKDISNTNIVKLFSHLNPQYEKIYLGAEEGKKSTTLETKDIHPSIIKIALKYSDKSILGSNSRCIALLQAFKEAINDFQVTGLKTSMINSWYLQFEQYQKKLVQYIVQYRPISISMGNSINFLKKKISELAGKKEHECKTYLNEQIDKFIDERIIVAHELITKHADSRIVNGDVIVIYAASSVVEQTIVRAFESGKKFELIIVDSRPNLEGKSMLKRLTKRKIPVTYIFLNAISYVMKRATKVFLGAFCLLSNGNLVSRCGASIVALMAKEYNIPVILLCESYKFSEKVRLDSICDNELTDRKNLLGCSGDELLSPNWESNENLQLLNLVYDLTPINFITMVITEFGVIPPSSCYVIIREYTEENLYN